MVYLLQDFITENAEKNPDKLMIQDGDNEISFGKMDKFTNKFSRLLISCGVKRGDIITFYMKKSINSFKSLISILKADAVYAPLNVLTPAHRIYFMLKDSRCKFFICDKESFVKAIEMLHKYKEKIKILSLDSKKEIEKQLESYSKRDEVLLFGNDGKNRIPIDEIAKKWVQSIMKSFV